LVIVILRLFVVWCLVISADSFAVPDILEERHQHFMLRRPANIGICLEIKI